VGEDRLIAESDEELKTQRASEDRSGDDCAVVKFGKRWASS